MKKRELQEFTEQRIMHLQQSGPIWIDSFTIRQMMSISKSTLRRWEIKTGVTRYKISGKVFYDKREIDAAIIRMATVSRAKIRKRKCREKNFSRAKK
jgi:predicted transcriptional regulator